MATDNRPSNERLYGAKDRVEEIKRTIEDMRRAELRAMVPQDEALFLIGEIERLTRENATLRSVCALWGLHEDPQHEANVARAELSAESSHASETKPPRCPHYWHEHGNRCVLEEGHRSEHYFTAPASAIDPDKEFRWPPLNGEPKSP